MKTILNFILVLALTFGAMSCRQNRSPYHTIVYDAQGNQMVKVQDYDANGNLIEYYMAAAMFNNLYNNGGYRSVNSYYYDNRPNFDRNYNAYDRAYQYDSRDEVQNARPVTTYRKPSPSATNSYTTKSEPVTYNTTSTPVSTYRKASPSTVTKTPTVTYRKSSPSTTTYRSASPSSGSTYKSSSSSSSYRSSSPSTSSYRSSSPSSYSSSSSYRSSSPSSYSSSRSSSSSSYRSSSPR